jgi:hypothetical protein
VKGGRLPFAIEYQRATASRHKRPFSETSDYQRATAPAQKIQPRWQHFDPVGKLLMHDGSSRAQSTTPRRLISLRVSP